LCSLDEAVDIVIGETGGDDQLARLPATGDQFRFDCQRHKFVRLDALALEFRRDLSGGDFDDCGGRHGDVFLVETVGTEAPRIAQRRKTIVLMPPGNPAICAGRRSG
jgi:hypothetical protein